MRYYVSVVPNSSRIKVEKIALDLKVWLSAPPEKNRANRQLVKVLANHFSVRKSQVRILAGLTAKRKLVEIDQESLN